MLKSKIVIFFYINDIVFCYKKTDKKKAQKAIKKLNKEYQISIFSKLQQFLKIYMLCNYSQRLLQLLQEAYIKKIANQYKIDLTGRLPDTPIAEAELLPTNYQSIRPISLPKEAASTILYQKKMGSVLYTATTICLDIAFTVSRLARFNQDSNQEHY